MAKISFYFYFFGGKYTLRKIIIYVKRLDIVSCKRGKQTLVESVRLGKWKKANHFVRFWMVKCKKVWHKRKKNKNKVSRRAMLEARNSTGWLTQTVVSHTKRMGSKFLLHTHGEAKIVPFPDYRFSFSNKRYCRILVSIATVKNSKAAPSKQPTNASLTDQIESSGSF